MKKVILIFLLLVSLQSSAQTVFGYWYGFANVKTNNSANNYLVEMVLQPEKNYVKAILNYYFKNTFRSIQVKGDYNPATRKLNLYNVPVVYHGSISTFEVDCNMNLQASLMVSKEGSYLKGLFRGLPEYKNTCPDIAFNFKNDADASQKDSVIKAMREYKELVQVWTPTPEDTVVAVTVTPRKVVNYVTEKEYTERENVIVNEIEVESDSLQVSIYDNGEIDGDMISLFYNKQLVLNNQKLTHKSIKVDITLDSTKLTNEISMFAENLGLIPPNTALVVINDGKNKFELRLSSSLEKNATIRIKRKKN